MEQFFYKNWFCFCSKIVSTKFCVEIVLKCVEIVPEMYVETVPEMYVLKLYRKFVCWNCNWKVCVETVPKYCFQKISNFKKKKSNYNSIKSQFKKKHRFQIITGLKTVPRQDLGWEPSREKYPELKIQGKVFHVKKANLPTKVQESSVFNRFSITNKCFLNHLMPRYIFAFKPFLEMCGADLSEFNVPYPDEGLAWEWFG